MNAFTFSFSPEKIGGFAMSILDAGILTGAAGVEIRAVRLAICCWSLVMTSACLSNSSWRATRLMVGTGSDIIDDDDVVMDDDGDDGRDDR